MLLIRYVEAWELTQCNELTFLCIYWLQLCRLLGSSWHRGVRSSNVWPGRMLQATVPHPHVEERFHSRRWCAGISGRIHHWPTRKWGHMTHFYLRPVLAIGYCHSLCLCLCLCVCLHVNHELVCKITHHPFKLESWNVDLRWKTPWLRSLLFWVVISLELQFTPFWACLHHNSSSAQARTTKFGAEVQNT